MSVNGCEKCPYGRVAKLTREMEVVMEGFIPDQVRGHLKNARSEVLLALRGLADCLLEKEKGGESTGKPKNIVLD